MINYEVRINIHNFQNASTKHSPNIHQTFTKHSPKHSQLSKRLNFTKFAVTEKNTLKCQCCVLYLDIYWTFSPQVGFQFPSWVSVPGFGFSPRIGFQSLGWVSVPRLGFSPRVGFQSPGWVSVPGLGFSTRVGFQSPGWVSVPGFQSHRSLHSEYTSTSRVH